jgi:hypothetical protein
MNTSFFALPKRVAPEDAALSGMQRAASVTKRHAVTTGAPAFPRCCSSGQTRIASSRKKTTSNLTVNLSCALRVLPSVVQYEKQKEKKRVLRFGGEVRKGEAGGRAAKPRRIAVYVCLSVLHTYVHVHVAQSSLFARRGEEVAGRH